MHTMHAAGARPRPQTAPPTTNDQQRAAAAAASKSFRFRPALTAAQQKASVEAQAHFAKMYAQSRDIPTVGAESSRFAKEPGFFNILYTHPLYGIIPAWGEHGIHSKDLRMLPPVNSVAGFAVPPASRRRPRTNWGPAGGAALPRPDLPVDKLPASPSKHPRPCTPLPAAPKLRARTTHVDASTKPWLRRPPHTDRMRAIYTRLYGPAPLAGEDAAAAKLQAVHRGRLARQDVGLAKNKSVSVPE